MRTIIGESGCAASSPSSAGLPPDAAILCGLIESPLSFDLDFFFLLVFFLGAVNPWGSALEKKSDSRIKANSRLVGV